MSKVEGLLWALKLLLGRSLAVQDARAFVLFNDDKPISEEVSFKYKIHHFDKNIREMLYYFR